MQQTTNFPPNTEAFAYRFNMRYKHRAYPNEGMCRIEIYKSNGDVLIIAAELYDNPGPSVINAAEAIYERLAGMYDLKINACAFVTLFNNESYKTYWKRDSYTQVILKPSLDNKRYCVYVFDFKHIDKDTVLALIAKHCENGAPVEMTEILGEVL